MQRSQNNYSQGALIDFKTFIYKKIKYFMPLIFFWASFDESKSALFQQVNSQKQFISLTTLNKEEEMYTYKFLPNLSWSKQAYNKKYKYKSCK